MTDHKNDEKNVEQFVKPLDKQLVEPEPLELTIMNKVSHKNNKIIFTTLVGPAFIAEYKKNERVIIILGDLHIKDDKKEPCFEKTPVWELPYLVSGDIIFLHENYMIDKRTQDEKKNEKFGYLFDQCRNKWYNNPKCVPIDIRYDIVHEYNDPLKMLPIILSKNLHENLDMYEYMRISKTNIRSDEFKSLLKDFDKIIANNFQNLLKSIDIDQLKLNKNIIAACEYVYNKHINLYKSINELCVLLDTINNYFTYVDIIQKIESHISELTEHIYTNTWFIMELYVLQYIHNAKHEKYIIYVGYAHAKILSRFLETDGYTLLSIKDNSSNDLQEIKLEMSSLLE